MKKTAINLFAVFTAIIVCAQPPQTFKYQEVVRDNTGNLQSNQNVSFRISIIRGSIEGYNLSHLIFIVAGQQIGNKYKQKREKRQQKEKKTLT